MKIWITGASSGIGEACAYLYAKRGAYVVVTSNEQEKLEAVADKLLVISCFRNCAPWKGADLSCFIN